ncbi:hypothetical protein QAD02_010736 [Eretmocerus hayati]|uniref:Uncharacterized protein n=1 Tax=Eretmocerus hayati TaxID=131215 RepID=A0ACC2NUL8_9HYME|nr:hypothetical protein QAD02_010736 [Eretmocerus hayati]
MNRTNIRKDGSDNKNLNNMNESLFDNFIQKSTKGTRADVHCGSLEGHRLVPTASADGSSCVSLVWESTQTGAEVDDYTETTSETSEAKQRLIEYQGKIEEQVANTIGSKQPMSLRIKKTQESKEETMKAKLSKKNSTGIVRRTDSAIIPKRGQRVKLLRKQSGSLARISISTKRLRGIDLCHPENSSTRMKLS